MTVTDVLYTSAYGHMEPSQSRRQRAKPLGEQLQYRTTGRLDGETLQVPQLGEKWSLFFMCA